MTLNKLRHDASIVKDNLKGCFKGRLNYPNLDYDLSDTDGHPHHAFFYCNFAGFDDNLYLHFDYIHFDNLSDSLGRHLYLAEMRCIQMMADCSLASH